LQESREACGGAGYMAENRIVGLRADLDVYATFEGDNTVLLQLVAKRLLTDRAAEFRDIDAGGVLRYVAEKAGDAAMYRTGFARVAQAFADVGDARRSVNQLRETNVQRELLTDRVQTMVAELGDALKDASKASREVAAAQFNDHQHELIEAARAYAELVQWEAFTAALATIRDPETREVL